MKSNKGFSLVELIVVIAIMAIIAVVAVPVYNSYITKAQDGNDQNTIAEVGHAAEIACALNNGKVTAAAFDTDKKVLTVTFDNADACSGTLEVLPGIAEEVEGNDKQLTVTFEKAVSADTVAFVTKAFTISQ